MTPETVGVLLDDVIAGHIDEQAPVHAVLPELAVSLSKKYAVSPAPSTMTLPRETAER
jgi:hypothetical protein